MNSLKRTARIAGILILAIAVAGPIGLLVPTSLIVPGDAAATANNIIASETLFRIGMAAQAVLFLLEISLPIVLYVLLKPVNKTLSMIAATARLAMGTVQGINVFNHLAALQLLGGGDYMAGLASDQVQALVLFFLNLHIQGELIWGLFFALHLLLLGYLVSKADYFPGYLGAVLGVASLCYLLTGFGRILLPGLEQLYVLIGYSSIIELAFPIWLLIKGVKEQPAANT
ncbi:MAG: DUF4386 domain-containing protein [Anaerolineae bacterium]|jgi:hypothetical protein